MAICTGKIASKSEEGLEDEVVGIQPGKFSEVVIQEGTGDSAPGFPHEGLAKHQEVFGDIEFFKAFK